MSTTKVTGTMRKIGIEGGLWAVVSDAGESWELIDAPAELESNGLRVEVEVDATKVDVTIGMMGRAGRVKSHRRL